MIEFAEDSPGRAGSEVVAGFSELTPEQQQQYSADGLRLFIKASIASPASVTAQGAQIALSCHEEEILHPRLLSKCLRSDEGKINRLVVAATKVHKSSKKGPTQIDAEAMRAIIKTDFDYADTFFSFSDEDLHFIIEDLPKKLFRFYRYDEGEYYSAALEVPENKRKVMPRQVTKMARSMAMTVGEEIFLRNRRNE